MPHERAILCGSVAETHLPIADPNPLRLLRWVPGWNIDFKIEDLRRSVYKDLPPKFLDLIDIAVYVYCADQALRRGGKGVQDFGDNWRRRLFFRLPVREPDLWKDARVHGLLVSTLSFLSEDEYHFEFEPLRETYSQLDGYFNFNETPFDGEVEEVVLFSGGLDSLAGAVQESVRDKRKVLLVNHRSTNKLNQRHRALLEGLNRQAGTFEPLHLPVRINKAKELSQEYTQRSRSFLFASLAATMATMIGLDRIRFYENGVVSLNLPLSPQVVGARATRTTHPRVLHGFAELFSQLNGKPFAVENPFRWKTKTEIVKLIGEAGCADLIGLSTSCMHTWEITHEHTHCGNCSQCIDRRFGILASGLESHDPASAYKVDLFLGERIGEVKGDPRTMLASYVESAKQIKQMRAAEFFSRYGEIGRALPHCGGSQDATANKIYDLYQRHAADVSRVVKQGIALHSEEIFERTLPPSCLLRLVCDTGESLPKIDCWNFLETVLNGQVQIVPPAVPPAAPPAAPPDPRAVPPASPTSQHDNIFVRRGQGWDVRYAGGATCLLLPSKGADYLQLLLGRPGVPMSAIDMACQVARHHQKLAMGNAGDMADEDALASYHARCLELKADMEKAERQEEPDELDRLRQEHAALLAEINAATGLGGRLRRAVDDRERIRKAVGNAIRRAIKEIASFDQGLAKHLTHPVLRCGMSPCYSPSPVIEWQT